MPACFTARPDAILMRHTRLLQIFILLFHCHYFHCADALLLMLAIGAMRRRRHTRNASPDAPIVYAATLLPLPPIRGAWRSLCPCCAATRLFCANPRCFCLFLLARDSHAAFLFVADAVH